MTFHNYNPSENTAPPAYIQQASDNAWCDPNRTWKEWWNGKKPTQPVSDKPTSDNLPYDHAFPYGHDANDPTQPYAPFGLDQQGHPIVESFDQYRLKKGLQEHPDPSDPESPLNPNNVNSPMDPSNMKEFFNLHKPGSFYHEYAKPMDEYSGADGKPIAGSFSDNHLKDIKLEPTPENFPWDQDPSHHYRRVWADFTPSYNYPMLYSTPVPFFEQSGQLQMRIALDSPTAPIGWKEVVEDSTQN